MDAEQFELALAEHQRMVFSIALHSLRDRALAEEIAQDVFLALYRHSERIESPQHLVHWLRCVTTRKCIDHSRRQRWRRWLPLNHEDLAGTTDAASHAGDPLLSARLHRLLGGLPPVVRLALVLRYQEDLDPDEIGRVLSIPPKTVKKHLARGLRHLKLRLNSSPAAGRGAPENDSSGSKCKLSNVEEKP